MKVVYVSSAIEKNINREKKYVCYVEKKVSPIKGTNMEILFAKNVI